MSKIEGDEVVDIGIHNDRTKIVGRYGKFLVTEPYQGGSMTRPDLFQWEVWEVEDGEMAWPVAEFQKQEHAELFAKVMSNGQGAFTEDELGHMVVCLAECAERALRYAEELPEGLGEFLDGIKSKVEVHWGLTWPEVKV